MTDTQKEQILENIQKIREKYLSEEIKEKEDRMSAWFNKNKGLLTKELKNEINVMDGDFMIMLKLFFMCKRMMDDQLPTCSEGLRNKLNVHIKTFDFLNVNYLRFKYKAYERMFMGRSYIEREIANYLQTFNFDVCSLICSFNSFVLSGTPIMTKSLASYDYDEDAIYGDEDEE